MADQLVGRLFGGYEILEEIGRGGMAVVYKARQISMDRIVAIKVLPRQFVHDLTFRARFEREVSIVAKLEHRAIVPVHDYGELDELPYIVMRYMPAGSVDDLLINGPMPPERVAQIVTQIADGLDYAHSRGVLHRDLKPSNILLDDVGDAFLTDFGIAQLTGSHQITTEGVVGTPAYMSPEQAQGLKLDGRSDVYGLAVVTFEMLTGRRPYDADSPYGIAVKHVTAPVPSARDVNPALSLALDHVLRRGLAKNRAERYQTARDFAAALHKAIAASPEEVADSTAQTRPVDLTEAHKRLEEADEIYLSAPERGAATATPPSSERVRMSRRAQLARRVPRQRPLWLNVLLGIVIGVIIFGLLAGLFVVVSLLTTPPPTPQLEPTATATATGAEVTVVPLGPLHPAAIAMTQTAEAAPTLDGLEALSISGGRLVFFAARGEDDAELYLLDLATGLERPLTNNTAADTYPAVSPDGRQVVFVSDRDGNSDLYVLDLACVETAASGGESCESSTRQLTTTTFEERSPAWAADGSAIYYAADPDFSGQYNLFRIPAAGGDPTPITATTTYDDHPTAAPDGSVIVFSSWEADNLDTGRIQQFNLRTETLTTLIDNEGNDWAPSFSPDGTQLVFNRGGEGRAGLWIMDRNGTTQRLLYDGPGYDWAADWNPEGRVLAFTSDESGQWEIYLIAADGSSTPRKITTGGGQAPAWVP
ncbi:MAG: hypothetical protein Kow0077_31480 [Anaerolineae bacterium]